MVAPGRAPAGAGPRVGARPPAGRLGAAALAILGLLLPAGCGGGGEKSSPPPPPKVTVAKPLERKVTDYVEMPGTLQAYRAVELQARVEGYLRSIHFRDGERIEKGQLLFAIEPDPYQTRLRLAEAAVAQQRATVTRNREEYDRQQRMLRSRATSESQVQQWRAQYESAQAVLQQNEASAELARIQLGYTKVTAPYAGRIERHLVDVGNLVGAGGPTHLATLYQLDPIYAYFTVNEHDLARLLERLRQAGKAAGGREEIPVFLGTQGERGYPHRGRLDYAAPALDPTTATLQLRGVLPNPATGRLPALLPGMYARGRVPVGVQEHALLVPEDALGILQGKHYLLLVNEKNEVEQRFVTVGRRVGSLRVVAEGLKGSDSVVVSGLQRAHPGSKVTPVQKTLSGTSSD